MPPPVLIVNLIASSRYGETCRIQQKFSPSRYTSGHIKQYVSGTNTHQPQLTKTSLSRTLLNSRFFHQLNLISNAGLDEGEGQERKSAYSPKLEGPSQEPPRYVRFSYGLYVTIHIGQRFLCR